MKKLMLGVAPLLAVTALMIIPTLAQAAPNWNVCTNVGAGNGTYEDSSCTATTQGPEDYEWETLGAGVKEKVVGKGTGHFSLTLQSGVKWQCEALNDHGTITGGDPGTGEATLEFSECELVGGPVNGCPVAMPAFKVTSVLGNGEHGEVLDTITLPAEGAVLVLMPPCEEKPTPFGDMTGATTGRIEGGSIVFENSGGIDMLGESLTITGAYSQTTEGGELVTAE